MDKTPPPDRPESQTPQPQHIQVTASDTIPPMSDTVSFTVVRAKIRIWAQHHRIITTAMVTLVIPAFFGLGAHLFPGVVRHAFVICGWLILIWGVYLAWDVLNWPPSVTTEKKFWAAALLVIAGVYGTWWVYTQAPPLAPSVPTAGASHARVRDRRQYVKALGYFYAKGASIQLALIQPGATPGQIDKAEKDFKAWVLETTRWIRKYMGDAALGRFVQQSGMDPTSLENMEVRNRLLNVLDALLHNLQILMHTGDYDPQ